MTRNSNQTSKFSSKVKRINIALPNYKFFHSPSLIDQNDNRFIGRQKIIERLRTILTSNEPKSGAYLVTGYRGMGKSSYVNKVLNSITLHNPNSINRLLLCFLIVILLRMLTVNWMLITLAFISFSIFFWLYYSKKIEYVIAHIQAMYHTIARSENLVWNSMLRNMKILISKINYANCKGYVSEVINKRRRVVLKLNLGHEILNETDILSLIAKSIEKEFRKFAYSYRRQTAFYVLKIGILCFLSFQIVKTEPISEELYNTMLHTQTKEFTSTNLTTDSLINLNYNALVRKIKNDSFVLYNKAELDKSIISKTGALLIIGINYTDVYLDWGYCYLSTKVNRQLPNAFEMPTHLNYLFLLTFFLLNLLFTFIIGLILRSNNSAFPSRKSILRKLRQLNDHIEAAVKTELNSGLGITESKLGINVSHRRAKEYPLAGIRQMEKTLIDILDEIDNMVFPILRPQFIIVFDELDKIDPYLNNNISDKEEELTDFDGSTNGFSGGTATRLRKKNVLKLLANMKYFITTAKAKFIFISGRELYDAFLADVSDREFTISSIFHEVIYVESFLSDNSDKVKSDTVSMTEHYVCQFIIPEWYIIYMTYKTGNHYEALNLKTYESYLLDSPKRTKNDLEVKKAIMLLYQFVHYLTHVSNGAPKKITNLFERYIVSANSCNLESDCYIGKSNKEIYLSFSYMDQCKIGFIHYLSHPIILAVVNNVSTYGDKLLVSAAFLIDHIYKFHGNGFSWRNLEHAPEIFDINRTPELRNFIGTIIGYLSQTHISPIISGLFIFKFPKKISEEISFISKMSEEASALFNFTLDESLTVKRHYSKLLQHYTRQANSEKAHPLVEGEFIHSMADIHHILGDLHLFDEEYTEAIFEYQSCLQYISHKWSEINDSHQATHLLFIVRSMLKLGLTFEKRKTVNSAYLIYSELVSMAIDFRYINEKAFGLEYKSEKVEGWIRQRAVLYKSNNTKTQDEDLFRKETRPEVLKDEEKEDIFYSANGDELIPSLAKITTPLKNKLITRLSLFEDLGLMYQALLAKLFVLEKIQLGGISQANLDVIEGEFLNLHLAVNLKDKFLISADFFKKLGDIMFYKNGLINNESSTLFNGLDFWGYDVNADIEEYARNIVQKESLRYIKRIPFKGISYNRALRGEDFGKNFNKAAKKYFKSPEYSNWLKSDGISGTEMAAEIVKSEKEIKNFFKDEKCCVKGISGQILDKVISCNQRRGKLLEERNITPCYACKYYNRSLKILADNLLNQNENDSPSSKSLIFLEALDQHNKFYSYRINFSQILAATLGGFGDVLVSCSRESDDLQYLFLDWFFKYMSGEIKFAEFKVEIIKDPLSHLEKAVLYFLASAKYHKRSSNLKEAHVMYKKILLLLIQYVMNKPGKSDLIRIHIQNIEKQIVQRIIQCIYSAYEHIHVVEIQKLKWINSQELFELLDLNQLSLFPELEETLYAYHELKLLCNAIKINKDVSNPELVSIEKLYSLQALSPFRLNSSIYNRLISLRFKAMLNRKLFEEIVSGYNFGKDAYSPQHPILFYEKLGVSFLSPNIDSSFLVKYFKLNEEIPESAFLDAIEHLIVDSIFCLQKFLEIVYPHNKTTLFTNSYVASIYQQLFEWSQLFDFLFMLYAYMDDGYPAKVDSIERKKKNIVDKLAGHCLQRFDVKNRLSDKKKEQNKLFLRHIFSFQEIEICEVTAHDLIIDELRDKQPIIFNVKDSKELFHGRAKNLFKKLCIDIDRSNTHMIDCNYLAEMGIKKYQSAFAMHMEGKPYKNLIDEMYYLNDDLDNDSFKFYMAMERYRINSGVVIKNMKSLKRIYSNSKLFEVENYL